MDLVELRNLCGQKALKKIETAAAQRSCKIKSIKKSTKM